MLKYVEENKMQLKIFEIIISSFIIKKICLWKPWKSPAELQVSMEHIAIDTGTVTGLRDGRPRTLSIVGRREKFSSSPKPPDRITHPLIHWVPVALPPSLRRRWSKPDFFHSSIEVKNARSCNSTHICTFITSIGKTATLIYLNIRPFFSMAQKPGPPHYQRFTITLRLTTLGRTPLYEWSAQRRDLYLTTHSTNKRQLSMPPDGF
jgi:hypothetical protein